MAGYYNFSYVDTNLGPMMKGSGINRIFKKSDKVLSGINKSLYSLGKIKNEISSLTGYGMPIMQRATVGGCVCKTKKGSGLKKKKLKRRYK